jgi:hypothetical protein
MLRTEVPGKSLRTMKYVSRVGQIRTIFGAVVLPAVVDDELEVGLEVGEVEVLSLVEFVLHALQVHGFVDDRVVPRSVLFLHGVHERPRVLVRLDRLQDLVHPSL